MYPCPTTLISSAFGNQWNAVKVFFCNISLFFTESRKRFLFTEILFMYYCSFWVGYETDNQSEPCKTIYEQTKPPNLPARNWPQTSKISQNHPQPPTISQNQLQLPNTSQNHLKSAKTNNNFPKSIKAIQDKLFQQSFQTQRLLLDN